MDAAQEKSFRATESEFRQTILKAVSALLVTVASLLLFMVMPLLPRELMVFVAIGLGALAFKAPTLSLALMMLLAVPGYFYQLNAGLPSGVHLPTPIVAVMTAILLVVAVAGGEMGGTIGVAVGAIAAVLMLTPVQFLALPLMVGTILLRTKRTYVRPLVAVITFVVLYYPVLAVNSGGALGDPVSVLRRVTFHAAAAVPVLSVDQISARLGPMISAPLGNAVPYVKRLAEYWPLSPAQRLLPAGAIFAILMAAAMAAGVAILLFFRWLRKREVVGTRFSYAAPVACMLGGIAVFASLSSLLASPLNYTATISPVLVMLGSVLVGGSGSVVEAWLRKRDVTLEFREHLGERAAAVRAETVLLRNRTEETKAQCRRMDTSGEETLLQMCEQELAFAEQSVAQMSLDDLQQKAALFDDLQGKLHGSVQESVARLYHYHDEDWQAYNHLLTTAAGYGFALGESVEGPAFSSLTSMSYEDVLQLQTSLNKRYASSASLLAEGVEKLAGRIRGEVDADFKRAGLDIARDYLGQGHYAESLQEFLQELSEIEYGLGTSVAGLDKEILSVLGSLKASVVDTLMPTAANLGDEASVNYYREVIATIEKLCDLPGEKARLPDLMHIVTVVGEVGELVSDLGTKLAERIGTLETSVQAKTPRGYNWSIKPEILKRTTDFAQSLKRPVGSAGIRARMSLIAAGPSVVDSGAHAVRDYSVAHELLINYANVEYLIEEKLRHEGTVNVNALPVSRKYAAEYLELYRLKHPGQVRIERDMGRLTSLRGLARAGTVK